MRYASICAIAKDEDVSLKEWALFHLATGFEHFYIYDNGSKKPISELLADYVANGLVTVIDFPLQEKQQLSAYYHCLQCFSNDSVWIAFIDIDEFITPLKNSDIKDFLDDYREFGGIGIHWNMFGSNGYIKRPCGRVIENYTQSLGINAHIKSIIQTQFVTHCLSPHHFAFKDHYYCVNEDKFIIGSPFSYPIANKIQLNHYYYKSQQDFEEKIARGLATPMKSGKQRELSVFYEHINRHTHTDKNILRFLPLLKAFEKMNASEIATVVNAGIQSDLSRGIKQITDAINNGNLTDAENILRKLKRYHHSFELDLIHIMLLLTGGTSEKAHKHLVELYKDCGDDPDRLLSFYEQLKRYYSIKGRADIVKSISEFTGKYS